MKFVRLRIANYRGVASAEVLFAPMGITLIKGPNEAGKTSFGEAVGLLFAYPDSSRHHLVESIRPVHRDEGPEIELEAESGAYAFTYFKRFHKRPETRLTVTRPRPENHTGREAHDRAEAILKETLDLDLWKALSIQQGEAIQQPSLGRQTSLSAALDEAAGGRPADPRQEGLFEKVKLEYLRYYTERGAEKKELSDSRTTVSTAQAEVDRLSQELRQLEQDVERAAALRRERDQFQRREAELANEVSGHAAALQEISDLERHLEIARSKLETACRAEQSARRDLDDRRALERSIEKKARELETLAGSRAESQAGLNRGEEGLAKAQAAFGEADRLRRETDALVLLRRADADYYNNRLHLEQLQERKDRIDQARAEASAAEAVLVRNRVDQKTLKAIQDAERLWLAAVARLEVAAPSTTLTGLSDCRITVDGTVVQLGQDDSRPIPVPNRSRITVPGVLAVEICAGTSMEGLSKNVEDTRRLLGQACRAAGTDGPTEAREAYEARREAVRTVENRASIEKENLRDLSYPDLERKWSGLRDSVPAYLAARAQDPPICPDLPSARLEAASAEQAQRAAAAGWEAAHRELDAARAVRDGFHSKHEEVRIQADLLAAELGRDRDSLAQARAGTPDETLEAALAKAVRDAAGQADAAALAMATLKDRNPERVRALAEAARGSLETVSRNLSAVREELVTVQTRLKLRGEEGLSEKLGAAQIRLARVSLEHRALERRAKVARRLFETMRDERDRTRRAYLAPLKEKIEGLGRLVFDADFQVDVDDDLRIVARTSAGITVPFNSLSGGTREQLSLIFRLACSMIVARDGGMPLILDDALGYTDPERLRLMGAVLARAARQCQIVIFTCVPERYNDIGQAKVVTLG